MVEGSSAVRDFSRLVSNIPVRTSPSRKSPLCLGIVVADRTFDAAAWWVRESGRLQVALVVGRPVPGSRIGAGYWMHPSAPYTLPRVPHLHIIHDLFPPDHDAAFFFLVTPRT